ncbi:outer membrane protein transport protein [Hahella aquimaris]|uniref:OmpP1/FadL family transporter n=1 Tax=Hahella sp. HNIBRBA332 TaxID=3015983 RepID=UPI00273A796A|nr:outer membrane protein transport protein [Hahella sp. HNIBRBA332]WLQ15299.1 outer membrane protein transport protein [Hahella sp. HNIBRBA332]
MSLNINKNTKLLATAGLCAACWSGIASAQLATNLMVDPYALSLGNAVTAAPPGVASIHYNPAGLTKLKGRQLAVTLMGVHANIQSDFYAPEGYNVFGIDGVENDPIFDGDTVARSRTNTIALYVPGFGIQRLPKGPPALAPSVGFSLNPPGSKFTFANLTYGPEILGYYRKKDDPARYLGKALSLQRFTYLSPSFGYEINDEWSVGFGVSMSSQSLALDTYTRAPNLMIGVLEVLQDAFNCETGEEPLAPFLGLCGGNVGPWDDIGGMSIQVQETLSPKYHLGVLWEPTDWFAWGASYQSESDMKLKGTYELAYTDDWSGFWRSFNGSIVGAITAGIFSLPSGTPREAGQLSIDLTHPQHFQTGVSVKLNHQFTVNVDVGWTDYSSWDAFLLKFDRNLEFLGAARLLSPNATANTMRLPLEYQDVWNLGIGVEHHLSNRLDLRFGVEMRNSPIPHNRRDILAPLNDTVLYSVGMGYKWDRDTTVDFNLSYMRSWQYIPAGSSLNLNDDGIQNIVYNPYAGVDVETNLKLIMAGMTFRTAF